MRYIGNPIITRNNIQSPHRRLCDVSSVFNPGAIKIDDQYLLLLRVQNRGRETILVKAVSNDGINFEIEQSEINIEGIDKINDRIYHIYDPRITQLDEKYYFTIAIDTDNGCRSGLVVTNDFIKFEFLNLISNDDSRNAVLFPEKIKGMYYLLNRPNSTTLDNSVSTGSSIVLYHSENLSDWIYEKIIISGRPHYWDELIGSGPPPVKTKAGWLHLYHGVATHFQTANIYQAGVMLMELNNPANILVRSRYNILEPRETYELTGQVPNVVFPTGIIVERYDSDGFALNDSEVKIYYGAADSAVCLYQTTISKLIEQARE